MKKRILSLTIILVGMLTGCNSDDILNPNPQFDINLFEQNIIAGMGNQWVGYSYVINQNGQSNRSGASGKWATFIDGNISADFTTGIYLASVNKMIMAVAVLKAMDSYGTGAASMLNTSIQPYLPPSWNVHPNVYALTWRDVLTHRTGYDEKITNDVNENDQYNSNYQDLVTMVLDPDATHNATYKYCNGNYGLLRYLLCSLIGNQIGFPTEEWDEFTQTKCLEFLNTELFQPIGVTTATVNASKARYYAINPNPFVNGWDIGDKSANLGSGGLYMSPKDLARFLAYLNHTNILLNNTSKTLLKLNFAGLSDIDDPISSPTEGDHGIYYTKGGSLGNNGRGVRNIIMIFPNGVEIVIMGNTRGILGISSIQDMVVQAYDNAWQ